MRPTSWDCPYCGAEQESLLLHDRERHLRQCATCDRWFVVHEASATPDESGPGVEALGDPAECPADGCGETFRGDDLVTHVVERHGGSFDDE